jgi:hypothetical protein
VCPVGQTSIGPCVNGVCPTGYTCYGNSPNQMCCGAANSNTCLAEDAAGPCISGECQSGFTCDTTQQQCCPNIIGTSVGPCVGGTGCPPGNKLLLTHFRRLVYPTSKKGSNSFLRWDI